MAKKVEAQIKLQIPAGKANPSPPVGPALGQRGVNIMEFCKAFNANTQNVEQGLILPVVISVYNDRSFTFIVKTPPASILLKKAAGLQSGSSNPNTKIVATIPVSEVKKIAEQKAPDLSAATIAAGIRTIAGTARSMGIAIDGLEEYQKGDDE